MKNKKAVILVSVVVAALILGSAVFVQNEVTPTQVYMKYLKVVRGIQKYKDVEEYFTKAAREESKEGGDTLIAITNEMNIRDVEIKEEVVEKDTAIVRLKATTKLGPSHAEIYMMKEEGKWKINKEIWGFENL